MKTVVWIGVVSSLCVTVLDVLCGVWIGRSDLQPLWLILAGSSATLGVSVAAYAGISLLAGLLLCRVFKEPPLPVAVGVGLFVSFSLRLSFLADKVHLTITPEVLMGLAWVGLLSLVAAGLAYLPLRRSDLRIRSGMAWVILPCVTGEIMTLGLSRRLHPGPFLCIPAWVPLVGFSVSFLLSLCGLSLVTRPPLSRIRKLCGLMVLVLPAALILAWPHPIRETTRDHEVRRVILIVLDSLRREDVSCLGQTGPGTPHLDELSRDAVVFEDAVASSSWTLSSMASILTGLSPLAHLVLNAASDLPFEVNTLAERMSKAGYFTLALGRNPILGETSNMNQGFDMYSLLDNHYALESTVAKHLDGERRSSDVLTLAALREIKRHRDKDSFIWLHYFDPHRPYEPPSPFIPSGTPPPEVGTAFDRFEEMKAGGWAPEEDEKAWIRKLYLGDVQAADRAVGTLVSGLKSMGLYDDSLIVLTSDHGEEFWEHQGYEHGSTFYGEVIHVPLIVKFPVSHPQTLHGSRYPHRVGVESLPPTLLEACGIPAAPDEFSSPSLLPFLMGQPPEDLEVLSTGLLYGENGVAITFGPYRYIHLFNEEEEVFDLDIDPKEVTSLAKTRPDLVEKAHSLLQEAQARADILKQKLGITQGAGELDEDRRKTLKGLGYL